MSVSTPRTSGRQVDVRGPRFAAWITTGVLVLALVVATFSPVAAAVILALQTIVFALGAALGPRRSPYGALFARFVAPRLGAPIETEPVEPLRFAQLVGFVFALVGTVAFFAGAIVVGSVAAGFALFAALLNAAFGVCLGCRIYPLVARMRRVPPRPAGTQQHIPHLTLARTLARVPVTETSRIPSPKGTPMARSDVLVSADWAEQNLNAPKTVFVEVDEDTSAYDGGHIEGAVKLDWRKDLQDAVRRDFLNREQFSELLSRKGIANDDTVVLYGGNNNWFAAYAYWYFKLYGHQDVKLIDGGRKKWELDGRPLSKDEVTRPATEYKAAEPDYSIRAFRDEVIESIGTKNIVDVRSPDEFSGKILAPAHLPQEQAQQRGHVPGAINIPWSTTANEDGTFKSDEDLEKLYAEKGFDDSKETIAYCRIGERSSHTWFVLQEILGKKNVKNYDGSWVEYGSLVGAPIELEVN